jgi:hypothetical protein
MAPFLLHFSELRLVVNVSFGPLVVKQNRDSRP